MGTAGLYCRSNEDRGFVASIAVVADGTITDELEVSCTDSAAHAATLEELRVAASELLARRRPRGLVVWQIDPAPGGASRLRTTASAARAEGVVLAAASALAIDVVFTQGKAIVATTSASKAREAVDELAGTLAARTEAIRRAAAAAVSQQRD
jgi:hypothetical protein